MRELRAEEHERAEGIAKAAAEAELRRDQEDADKALELKSVRAIALNSLAQLLSPAIPTVCLITTFKAINSFLNHSGDRSDIHIAAMLTGSAMLSIVLCKLLLIIRNSATPGTKAYKLPWFVAAPAVAAVILSALPALPSVLIFLGSGWGYAMLGVSLLIAWWVVAFSIILSEM
jgi:hypothetical protein